VLTSPILLAVISPVRNAPPCHKMTWCFCGPAKNGSQMPPSRLRLPLKNVILRLAFLHGLGAKLSRPLSSRRSQLPFGLGLRTRRPQRTCPVLLHGRLLPRFTVARSKRRLQSSAHELPSLACPQDEAARVTTVATAAVIARGTPALVKVRVTNTCLALTSRRESARTAIPAGTPTPRPFPLRLPLPVFM